MHLCPDCLSDYKHSRSGRLARKNLGQWGKGKWPQSLYHTGANRKCERHTIQANADGAHRRAKKLKATPAWADRAAIKKVYQEARRLTVETGVKHEVDHVVPLQGVTVTGLHIAENLRAIPATENRKKSNHWNGWIRSPKGRGKE